MIIIKGNKAKKLKIIFKKIIKSQAIIFNIL